MKIAIWQIALQRGLNLNDLFFASHYWLNGRTLKIGGFLIVRINLKGMDMDFKNEKIIAVIALIACLYSVSVMLIWLYDPGVGLRYYYLSQQCFQKKQVYVLNNDLRSWELLEHLRNKYWYWVLIPIWEWGLVAVAGVWIWRIKKK